MHPGFIPVFAKFAGNVIAVKLKTRINKKAGQV